MDNELDVEDSKIMVALRELRQQLKHMTKHKLNTESGCLLSGGGGGNCS